MSMWIGVAAVVVVVSVLATLTIVALLRGGGGLWNQEELNQEAEDLRSKRNDLPE